MLSKKTGLKIELPIKDNNGNNLIIDDINKDIWDKIKKNIDNRCIKKGVANVFKNSNIIEVKKYPKVRDVCRYKIVKNGNNWNLIHHLSSDYPCSHFCDLKSNKFYKKNRNNEEGVILLVLESPHKDEYSGCFNPIAPANGKTGDKIEKYIIDILNKGLSKGLQLHKKTYYLIISNPVPYQASLNYFIGGGLDSDTRDKVWKRLFRIKKLRDIFKFKLENYKPDLIINACTGKSKNIIKYKKELKLNYIISKYLEKYSSTNIELIRCNHPSRNWSKNINRASVETYDKTTKTWK